MASEWICGPCWALVPRQYKRLLARTRRIAKRWRSPASRARFARIWRRCKRAAQEAAVGLR